MFVMNQCFSSVDCKYDPGTVESHTQPLQKQKSQKGMKIKSKSKSKQVQVSGTPQRKLQKKLVRAIKKNNAKQASVVLERGGIADGLCDLKGNTPLHTAVKQYCLPIISVFLQKGARINVQNKKGQTPLHIAAKKGYGFIVEDLVAHGADLDAIDNKENTPLHLAAATGDITSIQILMQAGADFNAKNKRSFRPIDCARLYGSGQAAYELSCWMELEETGKYGNRNYTKNKSFMQNFQTMKLATIYEDQVVN